MIIVKSAIVSDDIADRCFCCDLAKCKGQCCIEGDSGAPLEKEEAELMETLLEAIKPYMTAEGREAVEKDGVWAIDSDGDLGTTLVNGRECAFVCWGEDGTAYCAIERAYLDGKIEFRKPVSCHLYPIRVENYGSFEAVNYHRWEICQSAVECGRHIGEPLYKYLKEPLIRKFGEEWYEELARQIES